MNSTPFHRAEQEVQARLGVKESVAAWAREGIRPFMPDQHREFFEQLPFVVAAARDSRGRPWATILAGGAGFIESVSRTQLKITRQPLASDALSQSFEVGANIGLLGIELDSRRRNRVNGIISALDDEAFVFETSQSFGNCAQYITQRTWITNNRETTSANEVRSTKLDSKLSSWITKSDTFFIASGYDQDAPGSEQNGMDASHRGGSQGFVEVVSPTSLLFPDYSGNNFFNTIGNLVADPRVGLLFVDFEQGHLLQITGATSIDWDSSEVRKRPGAQRLIHVEIDEIVCINDALPIRWTEPLGSRRALSVTKRIKESENITSFILKSLDGKPLPAFKAGQHLPIELQLASEPQAVKRTYSISNAPNNDSYRISVKREPNGLVSKVLHDHVTLGDILQARPPAGDFVLKDTERVVVLVSAGVGVTPMMSMLNQLANDESERPILFIHGARNGRQQAFAQEVEEISAHHANVSTHIAFSQPTSDDRRGDNFDTQDRLSAKLIKDLLPALNGDFYLCGTPGFLADISRGLEDYGVNPNRIYHETF